MILTKQDLQEWNSHHVTRAISKALELQCIDVKSESCARDTCDQTAMQVMRNEGQLEGINMLNIIYEEMLEGAE